MIPEQTIRMMHPMVAQYMTLEEFESRLQDQNNEANNPLDNSSLLTIKETAKYLKVHERTVYNMFKDNSFKLRPVHIGRRTYCQKKDLDRIKREAVKQSR